MEVYDYTDKDTQEKLFIEHEEHPYGGDVQYHVVLELTEKQDGYSSMIYVPRKVMMDIASKIILSGNKQKRDILSKAMQEHSGDMQTAIFAAMDEYATKIAEEVRDELQGKRDVCFDFQRVNIKKFLQ